MLKQDHPHFSPYRVLYEPQHAPPGTQLPSVCRSEEMSSPLTPTVTNSPFLSSKSFQMSVKLCRDFWVEVNFRSVCRHGTACPSSPVPLDSYSFPFQISSLRFCSNMIVTKHLTKRPRLPKPKHRPWLRDKEKLATERLVRDTGGI